MKNEDMMIKKELEEEMKKIEVPSSLYDFAKNIKVEAEPKKATVKMRRNRRFQFAASAVITLGVITGSAFLNPSVAEMASKIPYLGQVFKTKSVDVMLWEALEKEGYKNFSLGMTPGEVTKFEISIEGSEKDADREREKITEVTEKVLKSKGYDSYKIKVSSYIPQVTPLSKEEEELTELGEKLEADLKKAGYEILTVNPFNSSIEISIPVTETRAEEIKNTTIESAKTYGYEKDVILESVDVEKNKREGIWTDYLRTIYEGLALKKEFHVTGYAYSYKQNKLEMFIKTNLAASDDEADETVNKIRDEINKFIDSEKPNSLVKEDEYEIIVRDKNGKELPY
ncbi:hypothetical protein J7E38_14055 [Bacillus sp. ISL-35]|uniref:hypothetical protein n=1 Tax=Bacillus sp. ISL-35 TaxID=2819122 RepID=UPI001BEB4B5F|nr:hypothetical protein [Bacillus sp. ISL-35]MBT2680134.1 hypothetical protein [Bacillus sp. ISL-35]MBT2704408.1 hypothetical protein [Chryseobacterium sp. ISL-80]